MKILYTIAGIVSILLVLISNAFALGPGFTGVTANADSAETVVTNPAGMTRFQKPSIYGNPMFMYTKSETEIKFKETGEKQTVDDDSFIGLPGLYYLHPIDERWVVGIGPTAATGLGATYDDTWAGRYLLKEWSLNFIGVSPSVAYRFNNQLSFGASVPIMYSKYELEKAVFNLNPDANDGKMEYEGDGWGVGFNFGILYEMTPETRFGLVYRSKVSVDIKDRPKFSGLTEERQELLNRFGALNQRISFETNSPQMVTAGAFHDLKNGWSFSLDLIWVDFSDWSLENLEIGDSEISQSSTNYKDIWGAAVGANHDLTPEWTVRSGIFYLSSALDEKDRTAFSRFDDMWGVGLGLEYKFKQDRSVSFDLTYIQFGDGKFNVQDVPIVGDIKGKYTTNYGVVFGIGTKW